MDVLSHPVVVAVIGTLLAAALGAAGYLLKRWLSPDKSDLVFYAEAFEQALPLIGGPPRLEQSLVYCEAVRFDLVVSRNQAGQQPIHIKRLEFEAQPVNTSPALPARESEAKAGSPR